jgi:hypothetical protein
METQSEVSEDKVAEPVYAGSHPCTVAGCTCQDFVISGLNSTVCATCSHSDKDHGLP